MKAEWKYTGTNPGGTSTHQSGLMNMQKSSVNNLAINTHCQLFKRATSKAMTYPVTPGMSTAWGMRRNSRSVRLHFGQATPTTIIAHVVSDVATMNPHKVLSEVIMLLLPSVVCFYSKFAVNCVMKEYSWFLLVSLFVKLFWIQNICCALVVIFFWGCYNWNMYFVECCSENVSNLAWLSPTKLTKGP